MSPQKPTPEHNDDHEIPHDAPEWLRRIAANLIKPGQLPKLPNMAERAIGYASENAEAAFAAALDLIGRRSDVVAVQLPEPDNGVWYINEHGGNVHLGPVAGQMLIDAGAMLWGVNTDEARTLAAALFAAIQASEAEGSAK